MNNAKWEGIAIASSKIFWISEIVSDAIVTVGAG